ncbi:hypothetical protein SUBVAR_07026 [Subdoligranulum variabile DSM 15176]|uniref:Uncharacterized protein n=1 Tax=Subdoligranulum variabile DSM 15176 TaxID=411471 RepID=D1PRJ7_9FIRM|nr:hypothetical protein SUBVAR_07026 [Subdoligranulum variabile DSM 15176]
MFLLCKEGTEEIPIKNPSQGYHPARDFSLEFFWFFSCKKRTRLVQWGKITQEEPPYVPG